MPALSGAWDVFSTFGSTIVGRVLGLFSFLWALTLLATILRSALKVTISMPHLHGPTSVAVATICIMLVMTVHDGGDLRRPAVVAAPIAIAYFLVPLEAVASQDIVVQLFVIITMIAAVAFVLQNIAVQPRLRLLALNLEFEYEDRKRIALANANPNSKDKHAKSTQLIDKLRQYCSDVKLAQQCQSLVFAGASTLCTLFFSSTLGPVSAPLAVGFGGVVGALAYYSIEGKVKEAITWAEAEMKKLRVAAVEGFALTMPALHQAARTARNGLIAILGVVAAGLCAVLVFALWRYHTTFAEVVETLRLATATSNSALVLLALVLVISLGLDPTVGAPLSMAFGFIAMILETPQAFLKVMLALGLAVLMCASLWFDNWYQVNNIHVRQAQQHVDLLRYANAHYPLNVTGIPTRADMNHLTRVVMNNVVHQSARQAITSRSSSSSSEHY